MTKGKEVKSQTLEEEPTTKEVIEMPEEPEKKLWMI